MLDAYSCKVVRWSMANYLRIELVLEALNMAIHNRCSAPGPVNHSDRSTEKYTSVEVGSRVKEAELHPSTGPVVDALDNALAESFGSALKRELLHRYSKPSRESVRVGIFENIRGLLQPA